MIRGALDAFGQEQLVRKLKSGTDRKRASKGHRGGHPV
jgi:hypothetical protein